MENLPGDRNNRSNLANKIYPEETLQAMKKFLLGLEPTFDEEAIDQWLVRHRAPEIEPPETENLEIP